MDFTSNNIQAYKELSNSIKESLDVNETTIKEKESHAAYYSNLPDGLTKDSVESLSKYNSKFVTAAHVAVGELASDILGKNKNVDAVEAEIGFFGKRDNIAVTVNRSRTYQNFLAKDGDADNKEITKHLVMTTTVQVSSAKGAALKSIKESMGEEFFGKFKS